MSTKAPLVTLKDLIIRAQALSGADRVHIKALWREGRFMDAARYVEDHA